jgi:hypothetical protein
MADDNPLTTLYNSLWATLESKADFVALFPHGTSHQIRYDTLLPYAPDPDQAELSPAEYPVCRITMKSAQPANEGSSCGSVMDVTFAIEICTGSEHQTVARAATWAIYRALTKWHTWAVANVTWNGQHCVAACSALDNGFTDSNKERNRGTDQWIVVWATVAKLYFATTDLETL